MILADTSIWIDHLRSGDEGLAARLSAGEILTHPHIIGELALGNLARRQEILHELGRLPRAVAADDAEVLHFIEHNRLFGVGIGYIDAHLLASVRLTPGAGLWTRDRRLAAAADRLAVSAEGSPKT